MLLNLLLPRGPPGPPEGPTRPKAQARPSPAQGQISEDLEIWGPGNLEMWNPNKSKKQKFSKSKSVLPKMSARSGLLGTKSFWPYWGPSEAIFSMDHRNQNKINNICLFSLVGQWALFTWGWGNRYVCLSCPIWQACDHQNTGVKSQVLGTAVTLLDNSLKCKWLIQKIALAKDNDSWSSICYCFLDP